MRLCAVRLFYGEYYEKLEIDDYTLSVLELSLIEPLTENVITVAKMLNILLDDETVEIRPALEQASKEAIRFEEDTFADLYSWYMNVMLMLYRLKVEHKDNQYIAVCLETVIEGVDLLTETVMYITHGGCFGGTYGVAIYLPYDEISEGYTKNYCVRGKMKEWLTFLRNCLDANS